MKIEDHLVVVPKFYAKVQKTKIVVALLMGAIALMLSACGKNPDQHVFLTKKYFCDPYNLEFVDSKIIVYKVVDGKRVEFISHYKIAKSDFGVVELDLDNGDAPFAITGGIMPTKLSIEGGGGQGNKFVTEKGQIFTCHYKK